MSEPLNGILYGRDADGELVAIDHIGSVLVGTSSVAQD